ncbi:hypothetical protein HOK00_00275 [bacterium]|nr:hypothetical protein [bacterium]
MKFSQHYNSLIFKVNEALEYSKEIMISLNVYNKVEASNNDLIELELELTAFNKRVANLDLTNKEDLFQLEETLNSFLIILSKPIFSKLLSLIKVKEKDLSLFSLIKTKQIKF